MYLRLNIASKPSRAITIPHSFPKVSVIAKAKTEPKGKGYCWDDSDCNTGKLKKQANVCGITLKKRLWRARDMLFSGWSSSAIGIWYTACKFSRMLLAAPPGGLIWLICNWRCWQERIRTEDISLWNGKGSGWEEQLVYNLKASRQWLPCCWSECIK